MSTAVENLLHVQAMDRVVRKRVERVGKHGLLELVAMRDGLKALEEELRVELSIDRLGGMDSELVERKMELSSHGRMQRLLDCLEAHVLDGHKQARRRGCLP
jgi:hypothetical protein